MSTSTCASLRAVVRATAPLHRVNCRCGDCDAAEQLQSPEHRSSLALQRTWRFVAQHAQQHRARTFYSTCCDTLSCVETRMNEVRQSDLRIESGVEMKLRILAENKLRRLRCRLFSEQSMSSSHLALRLMFRSTSAPSFVLSVQSESARFHTTPATRSNTREGLLARSGSSRFEPSRGSRQHAAMLISRSFRRASRSQI